MQRRKDTHPMEGSFLLRVCSTPRRNVINDRHNGHVNGNFGAVLSITDHMTSVSLQTKQKLARDILETLPIANLIRDIYVKEVDSPWSEEVTRLRKKTGPVDVKLTLWKNDKFLYGRIYRLFLYISDALDPNFQYNRERIPHGVAESKARENYNHIWGIYVDSRVEKMGIESFFDKTLRRNLFIDTQKSLPWTVSNLLFEKLWNKGTFTHAEMIDYAFNLDKVSEHDDSVDFDAFEIEIGRSLMEHTAKKIVDNIASNSLRDIAYRILNFTNSNCKGTLIESSYYNIYFMYDQEIFAEMATTKPDALLITLFDFQSNLNRTYTVTEDSEEINVIQQAIKIIYDRIANHSRLKVIKNPYAVAVEK
jgi:hypothetical protein